MPKCTIDGKEVEFKPGENLITVAKRAGVDIPVFCYHPGLTVVAQCRMCYVEVEKMPKLQTACSTNAAEGMVVKTNSENVKKGRAGTMEFLLLNHPLDCPICDKSGECDLQDNSYGHGSAYMRHSEERRTYVDVDMGPVIEKNMNRCIHCTRCIRFGDEIAGIREMVAVKRGNNVDITTIDGEALKTEYAGNYADICPTGSLTLRDFRFRKRAWMLKKTASICEGCSKGCNIELQHEGNVVYRTIPRENLEVNKYWMCDEGRFNYHYTQDETRVLEPRWNNEKTSWEDSILAVKTALEGKKVLFLVGTDLTLEEMSAIREFTGLYYPGSVLQHFGTPGIETSAQDQPADKILKMTSKTSNLRGAEKLGIVPHNPRVDHDFSAAVVFTGGRAVLPELGHAIQVGVGVFLDKDHQTAKYQHILPGLAYTEKDGTIINHQGKEQKLKRAILPRGRSKSTAEILMLLANKKTKVGVA
ncbi:MAG: (2Fe-2S)-binding protein [Bdellovibrionales bacterium]|nr:(2Fe-2S)-binding protein [Bdellovibrionales bacterium]